MSWIHYNKKFFAFKKNTQTPDFSHFISIPFVDTKIRCKLQEVQKNIINNIDKQNFNFYTVNNPNLFHLTLCMLSLKNSMIKAKVLKIFEENNENIMKLLKIPNFQLTFNKITCFNEQNPRHKKLNDVIFLEPDSNEFLKIIHEISHFLITELIKYQIIESSDLNSLNLIKDEKGQIRMSHYHLTLMRIKNTEKIQIKQLIEKIRNNFIGITIPINYLDISTRFEYDIDKFYKPLLRKKIITV